MYAIYLQCSSHLSTPQLSLACPLLSHCTVRLGFSFVGRIPGALHWITQPYVHDLKYDAATQQIYVQTTSLFGTRK